MISSSQRNDGDSKTELTWQQPWIELLLLVTRYRIWLVCCLVLGLGLGLYRLRTLPPQFRSTAVVALLPRERPSVDATVDTGVFATSESAARKAASAALALPPNTDLYVTLLRSHPIRHSLATRIIDLGLASDLDHEQLVQIIKEGLSITSTEDGLISISLETSSPQLSTIIANGMIEEGRKASRTIERQLILSQAHYLDEAVATARTQLRLDEEQLEQFTQRYELTKFDQQVTQSLRRIRELDLRQIEVESDLETRLLSYSEGDTVVKSLRQENVLIDQKRQDLRQHLAGRVPLENYGEVFLQHESLNQRVRFRRDLLMTLLTQADIFRLRADQPADNFAVIRPAMEPSLPFGPSTKRELALSLGLTLFLGFALCLIRDQWNRSKNDPLMAPLIDEFRSSWLGPRRSARAAKG